MINATMYEQHIVVKITGGDEEFEQDLFRLRQDIPIYDRKMDLENKCWKIKNPTKYQHIPWVRAAISDRSRQTQFPI